MKKNIFLWILIPLMLIAGWYFGSSKPSKFNWNRTYRTDAAEPYDLSLFYATVKENWGNKFTEIPLKSGLQDEKSLLQPGFGDIYMFVGAGLNLSNQECRILYNHIADGGTAFISATEYPDNFLTRFRILERVLIQSEYTLNYQTFFKNKEVKPDSFSFVHMNRNQPQSNEWYRFDQGIVKHIDTQEEWEPSDEYEHPWKYIDEQLEIITVSKSGNADFIALRVGSGCLFLHANPVMFSNYYLTKKQGRDYAANVLKFLPEKRLVWDLSAVLPREASKNRRSDRDMLSFIRSQSGLWAAWKIMLVSVALFLIFAGRRLQRSIPVIKPPVNHTMAFVKAVGRFYYGEKENTVVFRKEWNQFLVFIRQHFRIATLNSENELSALADRSGVDEGIIRDIRTKYEKYCIFTELKGDELLDMNRALSRFYKEYKNKYGRK